MLRMRPREQAFWVSAVYLWMGCIVSYLSFPTWVFGDLVPIFHGWQLYTFLFYAAVMMTGIAVVMHEHTSTFGYAGDRHMYSYNPFRSLRGNRSSSSRRDADLGQALQNDNDARHTLQQSIATRVAQQMAAELDARQAELTKQAEAAKKKKYDEEVDMRPRYEQLKKKDKKEEHPDASEDK